MAWSISITAEGWDKIREALEAWSVEQLAAALADYNFEKWHGTFGRPANPRHRGAWRSKRLSRLPHDILVDACFAAIEDTNTCDSGGWAYWIDPEGCHKVMLDDD